MGVRRCILRSSLPISSSAHITGTLLRSISTTTANTSAAPPSHHNHHRHNQDYLQPNQYINSWKSPVDPKSAAAKLAQLRREYARQVKDLRREYSYEVELQRIEKQRKDDAKREAIRLQREERKASKAKEAEARAAQRKIAEEEFRQTLLKERAEKLENWRRKEEGVGEKRKEKTDLLRRQSSMWIDEPQLEKKLLEAITHATIL